MGSKREKRPGVWELRVHLGRDPLTGKVLQQSRTHHGGARSADKALAELEATAARPGTDGTFGMLLVAWLERAQDDLSPTTVREYRRIIATNLQPALGAVPLRRLTAKMLDDLYHAMSARGLASGTVGQTHAVARRALNQAVRWDWLSANPANKASPPSLRRKRTDPPTVPELAKLIATARAIDPDLVVLIRVAAGLGARRGELCGLRWSDIDPATGTVTIARSVVDVAGRQVVKSPKTGTARTLTVDDVTGGVLAGYLADVGRRALLEAPNGVIPPDAYVFSREPDGSRPLDPNAVSKAFRRVCTEAGLVDGDGRARFHLHTLRHLNATLQLAAGVPVHTVSARLGHDRTSTTSDIYGHAVPANDAAAAATLGRLLGPGAK